MLSDMLDFKVECPSCKLEIRVPFFRELEAKAIEEFDLAEISAQDELTGLRCWLHHASLFALLKFWLKRE